MEASRRITIKIYRNNVYLETKQYADPPKQAGDILDRLRDIQRVGDLRHGDLSLSALDMLEGSRIYELHLAGAGSQDKDTDLAAKMEDMMALLQTSVKSTKSLVRMILLGQLRPTSSTSSKQDADYRKAAILYYHGNQALEEKSLPCMLTGTDLPVKELTAAHIFRRHWNPNLMALLGMHIHDPCNILLLTSAAEKKFDQFEWTVIPYSENDYKVVVLNPRLKDAKAYPMEQYITAHQGPGPTWQGVDNKLLHLPELRRPARRVCGIHAAAAIASAEAQGWVAAGSISVPAAAYASDGWDSSLMQQYLIDQSSSSSSSATSRD